MQKTLTRLEIVSELYQLKLQALIDSSEVASVCKTYYESANSVISDSLQKDLKQSDAKKIYDAAAQVTDMNNALKTKSCPVIY